MCSCSSCQERYGGRQFRVWFYKPERPTCCYARSARLLPAPKYSRLFSLSPRQLQALGTALAQQGTEHLTRCFAVLHGFHHRGSGNSRRGQDSSPLDVGRYPPGRGHGRHSHWQGGGGCRDLCRPYSWGQDLGGVGRLERSGPNAAAGRHIRADPLARVLRLGTRSSLLALAGSSSM